MLSTGNYLGEAHTLCAKMELPIVVAKEARGREGNIDLATSSRHKIIRFAMLPAQMLQSYGLSLYSRQETGSSNDAGY